MGCGEKQRQSFGGLGWALRELKKPKSQSIDKQHVATGGRTQSYMRTEIEGACLGLAASLFLAETQGSWKSRWRYSVLQWHWSPPEPEVTDPQVHKKKV
jgi:hypothetical protein